MTKNLKIKLVYTENPSADVFLINNYIKYSRPPGVRHSLMLPNNRGNEADLFNFGGGGEGVRNYSQTRLLTPLIITTGVTQCEIAVIKVTKGDSVDR